MNLFLFDASALTKRFVPETGSALIDHLFACVTPDRLGCLMLGAAEVVASLVRKRNRGQLSQRTFAVALAEVRTQVLDEPSFQKLPADNPLIDAAIPFLDKHSINATDAVVLRTAAVQRVELRDGGNDLVLVASDLRLVRAARAEGLLAFDPETQPQSDLDALLGP